jgi:hypothetical protein
MMKTQLNNKIHLNKAIVRVLSAEHLLGVYGGFQPSSTINTSKTIQASRGNPACTIKTIDPTIGTLNTVQVDACGG